jgi:PTH1 family peptidyl-tRNA hydrolase
LSSLWGRGSIAGEEVLLLKPQTYMNRSGDAVRWAASELSLEAESIVVAYDDSDLAIGRLRLRHDGGSGGHKGVESIIGCLGSSNFNRVRLGIGRPESSAEGLSGYVLTPFTEDECVAVDDLLVRAVDSIELLIREGIGPAMNRFNPVS